MTDQEIQTDISVDNVVKIKKIIGIATSAFIVILGAAVFQDYLESTRKNYPFNFDESILFNTISAYSNSTILSANKRSDHLLNPFGGLLQLNAIK